MSDNPVNTRHHYIPQFYLRGFSIPKREDCVWVYDLGKKNPYPANVSKVAQEKDFYTGNLKDGSEDARLEKYFGQIESNAAPIIKRLRASDVKLGEDDFLHLMNFAAHMFSRVPLHRNSAANFASELAVKMLREKASVPGFLEKQWDEWEAENKSDATVEDMRNFIFEDGAFTVDPHRNLSLIEIPHTAVSFFEQMINMKWIFARPRGNMAFITSDNPFNMVRFSQKYDAPVSLKMPDIQITLPLGSELCMIGAWSGEEGFRYVRDEVVGYLNERTILFSNKFVYASDKTLRIQELLNTKPLRPKISPYRARKTA